KEFLMTSRREFVKLVGAGAMLAPLTALYSRSALAAPAFGPGLGNLNPSLPLNTDQLVFHNLDGSVALDYRGKPLISLPRGFRYWVIAWTGQTMSDGSRVPGDHDGMAAFHTKGGHTVLIRNHELSNRESKLGDNAGVMVP